MTSLFDFSVRTIHGKDITLKNFQGNILLIVNVASECGFTPQYAGLETLYQKFKDKGFVVLGFPCNQFGAQEPGTETEIQSFCERKFHVTFPLFSKIAVNGPDTHPLYQHLKKAAKGLLGTELIKWNFTKFLVDRDGTVLKRFSPQTTPDEIETEIAKTL